MFHHEACLKHPAMCNQQELTQSSSKVVVEESLPATAGTSTQLRRKSCGCWILNRLTNWPIATPAGFLCAKWKKQRNMGNDSRDFGQSRVSFLLLHKIGIHLSASCQLSWSCRSNEENVCRNFALWKYTTFFCRNLAAGIFSNMDVAQSFSN